MKLKLLTRTHLDDILSPDGIQLAVRIDLQPVTAHLVRASEIRSGRVGWRSSRPRIRLRFVHHHRVHDEVTTDPRYKKQDDQTNARKYQSRPLARGRSGRHVGARRNYS